MKYKDLTLGKVEAVVNKMGGIEGMEKFLRGETNLSFPNGKRAWTIWKTIRIGNFTNVIDLSNSLNKNEVNFDSIETLLDKSFKINPEKDVDLVLVSLKDLGIEGPIVWKGMLEKAEKLGLSVCPSEVGLQLRLQYRDQQSGEVLILGMFGLIDSFDESYHVFTVWNGEYGLCIDSLDPIEEINMYEDACFVFMIEK